MNELFKAALPYAGLFSIAGGAIAFTWTIVMYFLNSRRERAKAEFERFHDVMRKVQFDEVDGKKENPYIEIQVSAIYELSFLKRYYPLSSVYLAAKRKEWLTSSENEKYQSMGVPAIDLALKKIDKKSLLLRLKDYFVRFFTPTRIT
ncbi:hypothetical protein [Erwinia sp.]|uniref:hypothetical protein n=1 Tax=Erwinia citreus TaxID=558 RepID=UPI00289900AD|nr:hypothetical protein [Erwinia sp.]